MKAIVDHVFITLTTHMTLVFAFSPSLKVTVIIAQRFVSLQRCSVIKLEINCHLKAFVVISWP